MRETGRAKYSALYYVGCVLLCYEHHNIRPVVWASITEVLMEVSVSTLDELMKIHPPGTKFTCKGFVEGNAFECWFEFAGEWHGVHHMGPGSGRAQFLGNREGWSPYQEPPRKVKKFLWAAKAPSGGWHLLMDRTNSTPTLMSDDEPRDARWTKLSIIDGHIGIEVEDTP